MMTEETFTQEEIDAAVKEAEDDLMNAYETDLEEAVEEADSDGYDRGFREGKLELMDEIDSSLSDELVDIRRRISL